MTEQYERTDSRESSNVNMRYEKCRECGKEWNVSKLAEIPLNGYLCPRCWSKCRFLDMTKGAKK